jgi:lysophospholipase L1-like esterase
MHRDADTVRRILVALAVAFAVADVLLPPSAPFGSLVPLLAQGRQPSTGRWVGTWATAVVGRPQTPPPPGPPAPPPFMASTCPIPPAPANRPPAPPPGQTFGPQPFVQFTNQTLRQIVHTTLGGSRARVVLSNVYGTAPVTIGAAHLAIREKDDAIRATGGHALTFSGRATITIPANAVALSDPVAVTVPPLTDVAVDLYLPGTTNSSAPLTMHNGALQTSYVSETGNHAGAAKLPTLATTRSWFLISRLEVDTPDAAGVIVALGDSITDGSASTPDTNSRWPDVLATRLLSPSAPIKMSVVNAGIGGNRVLNEGAYNAGINVLARYEIDALGQTGVTHIIVLEGINDIGNARQNATPTAEDLIAAHKQLIERAHARGLKIIGATLTPFWGAAYYTEVGEAKRKALNEWIRTGKAYDGVIDFDKATRDPNEPGKLLAAYDSCDHLHPSDAGYKAMAESIDLNLFRSSGKAPSY